MKKTALLFVVVAMIGCNNASNEVSTTPPADTAATAAPKEETPPPPAMDSAAQMARYMECATPNNLHKMLATSVGSWTFEQTMWMDEGKPPMSCKGTCENKMLIGGRYLQSSQKGEMMGMPFEGIGTLAYDISRNKFVNTWMDNWSTGIMMMEGDYDTTTKVMNLAGEYVDPVKGKMKMRQVYKIVDDKHHEMEMYGTGTDGKEHKWFEMKLAKK